MFESDDYDQILSQFDVLNLPILQETNNTNGKSKNETSAPISRDNLPILQETNNTNGKTKTKNIVSMSRQTNAPVSAKKNESIDLASDNLISHQSKGSIIENTFKMPGILSPKKVKRKMLHSFFDTNSKRKFPGPAGLLTGSLEESSDDNICHMELLSQDIDFSQNNLRKDIFESPLWERLQQDVSRWDIATVDSVKTIKRQALAGHLQHRKAQMVTAFVEAVDRSATDPLIILRDSSGSIQCTLHRDAWVNFSTYISSEYCALVLWKPTVLTTGGAFKKHYLNITLSNIYAIYSTAVLNDEADSKPIPNGFSKVYEEEFTVIKTDTASQGDSDLNLSNLNGSTNANDDLLDGLDDSIFLDDIF